MFSISLLPPYVDVGPDGQRLGEIVVGTFRERFAACWRHDESPSVLEAEWATSLQQLLHGKSSVALRTDPRFAWILYREDRKVYVQQQGLFPHWEGSLDSDGTIESVPPRRTLTDEGERISEWQTTVEDIRDFLTLDKTV